MKHSTHIFNIACIPMTYVLIKSSCPVNQRAILTTVQRPILTSILWLSDGFLALFEAERIVAGFDDVAMVGDTVEQG